MWNGQSDDDFRNAAIHLSEVVTYIHDLGEPIYGQNDLYAQKILQNTPIYSFYERDEEDPFNDVKQSVILSLQGMRSEENGEEFDDEIGLQFYAVENPQGAPVRRAANIGQHLAQRRDILVGCTSCQKFSVFMKTCFPDIIFAEDIEKGIHGISDFGQSAVRTAIVHDLGVLNDEAVAIYKKHHPRVEEMFRELSAKGVECSPDKPGNRKYLMFSFSYPADGEENQIKDVYCSPHTKLIRKNSNLRIYFAWNDAAVGAGEKVLVGHIGRHPYPKR